MSTTNTGLWLQQYVEPQLLEDFRNYNDDFIGVLKAPNPNAVTADGIRFNKLVNNVGFFVNKSDDFTASKMTGEKTLVEWDKLDTTPTECTDSEARNLAFNKESAIKEEHFKSFKIGVRDYALNKLAPSEHKAGKMPVIRTTGAVVNGRKRLTYADMLNFLEEVGSLNLTDQEALQMVLNTTHRMDLMHDEAGTANHRNNLVFDPLTGKIKRFYNLNLFENATTPLYGSNGKLKSLGSATVQGDQKGSIFFYQPNTVYHIEDVKVQYKPMSGDTRSADPKSELRLHAYGLCDKVQEHGFGAIISDNA
ncbi:hypothetical protein BWK59_08195 [Flavobacterium davisii]|uniref:Phage capsid protein n=1 Tax=Flavobacterium davisii TaxID=2906077 RepID=A0A246GI00_9FLAO|nr:hypothetical protein [Flavobacterium davisii]OWP83887.1 hypothetical protein BWK59_08195 [Flavobacterium davisii]